MATTLTISILADVAKAVQGIDSIDKRTQSWGESMKGVALGIGSAFSVEKVAGWAESWISSGLEANRALKNVSVTFGEAAESVDAWAESTGAAFGMTSSEAEQAAAKVGVALKGYGFSQSDAAKASEELVQRSADIAKVLGVDQTEVLSKVETAMRGRTAGLKDYGVQVDKGSSSTQILNDFMAQTATYAGQADTPLGQLHATFGNISEQLGQALIPALNAVIPLVQTVAAWATNNKTAFDAIVIVITALALAFGIATTAAGLFAVASLGALWPILLVVAGVAALVAAVILIIKYWGDLVGWFDTGKEAVQGVIDKLGPLILLFGPLGVAIGVIEHFGQEWDAVKTAVDAVAGAIEKVINLANSIKNTVGGVLDKINPFSAAGGGGAPAAAGVSAFGVAPMAAPVTFSPHITFTGDVGDPTLAGRRIVAALETWVSANGRRRIAAAGVAMTRPASLAGAWWADFALVTVELGLVDAWTPSGSEWDGATWDASSWGESYLTPNSWLDVTADVESLDLDTGRNGVDDPGDVAAVSVVLFDPVGAYAIAGSEKQAVGNLLRISVVHIASNRSRVTFHGKVTDASAVGDFAEPTTTIKAIDLLGALLSTDDTQPLAAQSVTARIAELCDRAGVPAELRDLADDGTSLLAVDKAGSRLDAARDAAASSVGGTIWAAGDGTITYRFGEFLIPASAPGDYSIGTVPGAVCPAELDLAEKGADVVNVYDWTTSDKVAPLNSTASDTESIRRFGRGSSVRTDLLNAVQADLDALVQAELGRTAWAPERVDTCEIPLGDDASAELVLVQIGEIVDFAYTGSSPWASRQLVGSYAHHITPDDWTIDIKAYPAVTSTQWDVAQWDVDSWSLGAIPTRKVA